MKHGMSFVATFALAVGMATPAAAQSLPRTANGGGGGPAGGSRAVRAPRHPYAGNWSGTITWESGTNMQTPVTISFSVADGPKQAYDGVTTLAGERPAQHLNISAASASSLPEKTVGGPVARRAPQGGEREKVPGPSANPAPEPDILGDADHALLLYHTPSKSMLLCGEDGRCGVLATLTWEEQGAAGAVYSYSAKLVEADTLTGVVRDGSRTGAFTLIRR